MEGDEAKVRKRGWSSSSPSAHTYRFKRALLMVKRRGSTTTPVPTWKMIGSQSHSLQSHLKLGNANHLPLSARKLAALMWEIDAMPSPILNFENFGDKKSDAGMAAKQRVLESSKLRSLEFDLSAPSLTTVSHVGILNQAKLCSCRRRALGGCRKPRRSSTSIPTCLGQVDGTHHGHEQIHGVKNNLKDVLNGLITSKQLLDVLSRVWGIENPECISSTLISALGVELDRSSNRVSKLIQGQKREKIENDVVLKKIIHSTHHAVPSIVGELKAEKKLRQRSEKLNKKIKAELAETRESLARSIKELESEKNARRKVEQVCEELARGVWELKRQFGTVREEVEKEREMFQLADLLREERVQMKLSDARCLYEEKNALVGRLRNGIEAFLKGDRSFGDDKRKELEKLLRDSLENHEKQSENDAGMNQVEMESDDSDLHSIELSLEEISKSYLWGDAVKNASKRNFIDTTSKERIPRKQPFTQKQKLQMALI